MWCILFEINREMKKTSFFFILSNNQAQLVFKNIYSFKLDQLFESDAYCAIGI